MMKDMKPFERKRLTPFLTSQHFSAGEAIMLEGEEADAMFFLREGGAVASIKAVGEVARYEGGTYFGELALLMGTDRAATITADGETGAFCYRLGADHFRDVPKYVRLSFMKHAAHAYAKGQATGGQRTRAPSSLAAKSEAELMRYIESTLYRGKRLKPVSQRVLDDTSGNPSDSSSDAESDSDSYSEDEPPPLSSGSPTDPGLESSVDGFAESKPSVGTLAVEKGLRSPPPLALVGGGGRATATRRAAAGTPREAYGRATPPRRTKSVTFGAPTYSDEGNHAAGTPARRGAGEPAGVLTTAHGGRGRAGRGRDQEAEEAQEAQEAQEFYTPPPVPEVPQAHRRKPPGGGGGGGGGGCCCSRPPKDA